jgi:MoxR-like ATPase
VKAPILIITGAANELPINKELDAQRDRFVFSYNVKKISSKEDWIKFASRNYDRDPVLKTKFKVDEIHYITEVAKKSVIFPENFYELLYLIRQQVELFKIGVSARKFDNALDVFLISAFLNKRSTIDYSELFILEHILWKEIADIKKIKEILVETIFGNTNTVIQYIDNLLLEIKKNKNYINGLLYDFLHFRKLFETKDLHEFEKSLNFTKEIIDNFKILLNNINSVIGVYQNNMLIEKQIEENNFIINKKSPIFQKIKIENVYSIKEDIIEEIEILSEWVKNNSQLFEYNLKVKNQ